MLVKRKEKKAASMYEKNPVWKEEDAQGPIPGYKKGGTAKMKKYAMGGSALRPTTDKANRGMYQDGGIKSYTKTNLLGKEKEVSEEKARRIGKRYLNKKTTSMESGTKDGSSTVIVRPKAGTKKAITANFKTGGMVNSNSKITAIKTPGSKGVKSGVNPKANAQASAKGKVGGISKAPKDASPTKLAKAKMGGMKGKSC